MKWWVVALMLLVIVFAVSLWQFGIMHTLLGVIVLITGLLMLRPIGWFIDLFDAGIEDNRYLDKF